MKTLIVPVLLSGIKIPVGSPSMGIIMLKKIRSCKNFGGPVKLGFSMWLPVLRSSKGPKVFPMSETVSQRLAKLTSDHPRGVNSSMGQVGLKPSLSEQCPKWLYANEVLQFAIIRYQIHCRLSIYFSITQYSMALLMPFHFLASPLQI